MSILDLEKEIKERQDRRHEKRAPVRRRGKKETKSEIMERIRRLFSSRVFK